MPLAEFREEFGSSIEKVLLANISERLQVQHWSSQTCKVLLLTSHVMHGSWKEFNGTSRSQHDLLSAHNPGWLYNFHHNHGRAGCILTMSAVSQQDSRKYPGMCMGKVSPCNVQFERSERCRPAKQPNIDEQQV